MKRSVKMLLGLLLLLCLGSLALLPASAEIAEEVGGKRIYNYETSYKYFFESTKSDNVIIYRYTGEETDVVIPTAFNEFPVVGISEHAFENAVSMESVEIPDTITSIGHYAFAGCTSLRRITMPVTAVLAQFTFKDCTEVETVRLTGSIDPDTGLGEAMPDYSQPNGYKYFPWTTSKVDVSLIVEEGVGALGRNAFRDAVNLKNVTLPESLTMVGEQAFSGSGITEITLHDGTLGLGISAFSNCASLRTASVSGPVTAIPTQTFSGCTSLESITLPLSVTEIGERAFQDCASLKTVAMPAAAHLGPYCFRNCTAVESVLLLAPELPEIPEGEETETKTGTGNQKQNEKEPDPGAMPDYSLTSEYSYAPWAVSEQAVTVTAQEGVTKLGSNAFYGAKKLARVVIPDTVKTLGEHAFYGCTGLTELRLPADLTEAGAGVFYGCTGLTSLEVPDGVPAIFEQMFHSCSGLTELTLPNTVKRIGDQAFTRCTGLTAVTMPAAVEFGSFTFQACRGIASVTLTGAGTIPDCANTGVFSNLPWTASTTELTVTLPEGLAGIGEHVFHGAAYMKRVNLPESLRSLGARAFFGCTGLESLILPGRLTEIGEWAFSGCSGLTSLAISEGVASLPANAFSGCSALTELVLPESLKELGAYAFSACSALTDVTLPVSVSFSNYTFRDCRAVERVRLTGSGAMGDCKSPTVYSALPWTATKVDVTVELPEGVTRLGENAFRGAPNLKSINLPDTLTSLGDYALSSCTGLSSVALPAGLTEIGSSIFYGDTGLKEVVLPEGIPAIGGSMFGNCSGLTWVDLPSTVSEIGTRAFYGCTGLGAVAIPAGVATLDLNTFSGCTGLAAIAIPDSVTVIRADAFTNCTGLKDIYYSGTADRWGMIRQNSYQENTFAEVLPETVTVHFNSGQLPEAVIFAPAVNPEGTEVTAGVVLRDGEREARIVCALYNEREQMTAAAVVLRPADSGDTKFSFPVRTDGAVTGKLMAISDEGLPMGRELEFPLS